MLEVVNLCKSYGSTRALEGVSFRVPEGEMFGLLTTLRAGQGAQLTPVSTPLVLLPLSAFEEPSFGRIAMGGDHYGAYSALLGKVLDENYAAFIG